ncbi:hypothetical protein D3C84_949570 [compost metagenome]
MPLDQLALTHILDVYRHPALVDRVAEHIAVLRIDGIDLLLLHERVDAHDMIAQLLRALEVQFLCCRQHFGRQLFFNDVVSPVQETTDLLHHPLVRLRGYL